MQRNQNPKNLLSERKNMQMHHCNQYIADQLLLVANTYRNDQHRYKAYKNAAMIIRKHPEAILSGQQAKALKGIGESISKKVDEIIASGQTQIIANLDQTQKEKIAVTNLFQTIHGVGQAKAEEWYNMNYRNFDQLLHLYQTGQMTNAQMIGFAYYNDLQCKIPRSELDLVYRIFKSVFSTAEGSQDPTYKFTFAGSYRRGAEESGDLDVLFQDSKSDGSLIDLPSVINTLIPCGFLVAHLTEQPETKYMGVFKVSPEHKVRRIDIRMIKREHWACALLYFTGSKEFNIAIRNRAAEFGYSLSEYCMSKKYAQSNLPEPPLFQNEMDIFNFLKIKYVRPQDRVNTIMQLEVIAQPKVSTLSIQSVTEQPENTFVFLSRAQEINFQASNFAAFDLDGTIIGNIHGKIFSLAPEEIILLPQRAEKLSALALAGIAIFFFSNQKCDLGSRQQKISAKLQRALTLIDQPAVMIAALADDNFRKPRTGMFDFVKKWFPKIDLEKSCFCGDAAGREGDFSDSDLRFAENCGLTFWTPEQFFL